MDESFFTVIRQGDIEGFKAIIEIRGPSILTELIYNEAVVWPDFVNLGDQLYPIHVACNELQLELVKLMLDLNGACANQKTEFGKYSPLTFACTKGSRPLYDLLIERSATIDCYDSFGCTLLHWACSGGNLHLVKDLIKRGQSLKTLDNWKNTPFHLACVQGHSNVLQFIYEKDPLLLLAKDGAESTGLHLAASSNEVFATKWLLDKGLNINERNERGDSPLMGACHWGAVEATECLLDQGCATAIVNNDGSTAFHIAAKSDKSDEKCKRLIILRLMREKVKANVKNKEGKYPHHYLSGDLRLIVRSYWYKEHYAPLYASGEVEADQVKLCIVGDERVGKTTLAVAMGCDGDTAKRTAGIEVHRVQRAEFNGRVLVYDIAGHREFHCTHSFFLGGIATMFVLVINSSLSLAEIIAISQYWLAFILSSRYPADLGYQPYMLTVGSYGDTEESKRKQQLQLNDAMKVVQQEFHGRFTFVRIKDDGDEFILVDDNPDYDKDCVVLDCRNQHSEDMKKLLRLIGKIREKCLQLVPKVPVVCKIIRDEVLSKMRLQEKFQEREEFRLLSEKQSSLFIGKGFDLLLEYLTENGEVVDFQEKLVIDVAWLCCFVIGVVLADRESDDFHVSLQPDDKGCATMQSIIEAFKRFSRSKGVQFTHDAKWGVSILCHLNLCLEHPTQKDVYIFPCHIKKCRPLTTWKEDAKRPTYVGRRLQCTSQQQIITPRSFPVIQCEAKRSSDMLVVEMWNGGMNLQPKNSSHQQAVEALVEIPDKSRFIQTIDVIIRGPEHSQGDCMQFLDAIMHLIMLVLDKQSPGTGVQWCYISHCHLVQHTTNRACYSQKEINAALNARQDYVSHDAVQDRLVDLLAVSRDHILLLPSHTRSELCDALDFPQEGQPDGKKLSKAFGVRFRHNTSEVLDKLSADKTATVTNLINVLKKLNPPAVDAVEILAASYEAARGITLKKLMEPLPNTASISEWQDESGKLTVDSVLILHAVQRHGSDRWYAIGLEMGFSNSELTKITDGIPKHSDRLRAIVETKANEIGRENAAVSLLNACQTIVSPIYGIVADELSKSLCN